MLEEAWNLLSGDVQVSFRIADSDLNALNTVDLGPKRPFSVGECALWARLTGPSFAALVAAVVSLVEAPFVNHCKATTAEAVVAAAEVISVADLKKTKRLAAEFEALGSGALTMALAQEAEAGDHMRKCISHTSCSACRRPARSHRGCRRGGRRRESRRRCAWRAGGLGARAAERAWRRRGRNGRGRRGDSRAARV